jgi:hypothetical protein
MRILENRTVCVNVRIYEYYIIFFYSHKQSYFFVRQSSENEVLNTN